MIKCNELYKSFNSKKVIKNVSFKVDDGKITALIGKNGAGKSTLIGLIIGYYHLDAGSIERGSISVMPDADNLYLHWTGYEFLKFMAKIKQADFKQVLALAKELKIEKDLAKKIAGYSFGMKKKISFIQCAIGTYDNYIFDEPTSGVDVPSTLIMLQIIERLKKRGAGVLLTSHNIDELERVSDYVYILEEGKVVDDGTVDKLLLSDTKQTACYIIHSKDYQAILLDDMLPFAKQVLKKDYLEIVFDGTAIPEIVLKELINKYEILEFYLKKQTLMETIYHPNAD